MYYSTILFFSGFYRAATLIYKNLSAVKIIMWEYCWMSGRASL